jgi:alpha-beta hydrolase superfamily lysophospholipase
MSKRGAFVLGLALLAAACGSTIMREGPPVEPAHFDENADAVIAADGARLPMRIWAPAEQPTAVVVAVHGFNDYSHSFEGVGQFLSERGIAVYAYDQRGFGQAPHPGYWPGQKAMIDDLVAAASLIAQRHPGVPLYIMGESMGGAVTMVTMARSSPDLPKISGIILVAPAVWSRDDLGLLPRVALWVSTKLLPWMKLTGQGLDISPTDNDAILRELSRDPLVIKATRADTINGLVNLMSAAKAAAPKLDVPVLMLYGEHDQVVPAEPSFQVMEDLLRRPIAPVLALYAHGWHMLTRDREARVVDGDIASWIENPRRPLPSGADQNARMKLLQRVPGKGDA